jgi:RimJ/RimL family protein N-acetyltransferase
VLRWTAALPDPYTRADAEAWVREIAPSERAEGRGLPCVVESDGELVGSADLHRHHRRGNTEVEVGYWTAPWARRRGYASEAAVALTEWAFAHGAERVRLLTAIGNAASQGVARRAGFTREGIRRGGITKLDGSQQDAAVFVRVNGG